MLQWMEGGFSNAIAPATVEDAEEKEYSRRDRAVLQNPKPDSPMRTALNGEYENSGCRSRFTHVKQKHAQTESAHPELASHVPLINLEVETDKGQRACIFLST